MISIEKVKRIKSETNRILLITRNSRLEKAGFTPEELSYIRTCIRDKKDHLMINRYRYRIFILVISQGSSNQTSDEKLRVAGNKIFSALKEHKIDSVGIEGPECHPSTLLSCTEGLILSAYKFSRYFKDSEKNDQPLEKVLISHAGILQDQVDELHVLAESVFFARDLVNEPVSYLTAVQLAEDIRIRMKDTGVETEVFDKAKIEALKMGGLLAVNRGSIDPPTFITLEWKPENAVNSKPIVLVGKGVVYDTGGLSLKPTPDSMDYMKSDMAGAAAVAATIYAASKCSLPIHVIGLIPATDNRPDGNAYVPGDVIKMYNGLYVEVLNTDAEGRLILADALSYADKYNPMLVIDLATLTGAAAAATGKEGMVGLQKKARRYFDQLTACGHRVHERIVEFPLWDEYDEYLKSDIADMKNIGGKYAGSITAAKFLERFTNYPWIHLDIAGVAFSKTADHYRGKGGTGTGVRLLFAFLKNLMPRKSY